MKITIDKNLTSLEQKECVKISVADFKAYFTENDLVRMYAEEFDPFNPIHSFEVLKCTVVAFPEGIAWNSYCSFKVDVVIETPCYFIKLHYYIDEDEGGYIINKDPLLHNMEVYSLNRLMSL